MFYLGSNDNPLGLHDKKCAQDDIPHCSTLVEKRREDKSIQDNEISTLINSNKRFLLGLK